MLPYLPGTRLDVAVSTHTNLKYGHCHRPITVDDTSASQGGSPQLHFHCHIEGLELADGSFLL